MPLRTLGQLNPDKSLLIFDFFEVDKTLPKYQIPLESGQSKHIKKSRTLTGGNVDFHVENLNAADDMEGGWVMSSSDNFTMRPNPSPNPFIWTRLAKWITSWFKPKPVSVQEVFSRIKASKDELVMWDERDKALANLINQARITGQFDMLKKLEAEKNVRVFENILYAKGHHKFLTEAQLLEFTSKCERGLCLDWIKNFVRPIPENVVATKAKCDEDGLFDNYAILHFDPKNTATTREARVEEIQKRRDPILFGLVQGSRKLYFVGDWQDELCDLTFQQIVDKLGRPLEISTNPKEHALGE